MSFEEKLAAAVARNRSLVCVGLDVDLDLMGERDVVRFCTNVIEATADLVCAYKPTWAFYDALEPYLAYRDKGVFVWCRSSNPGAADFQSLVVKGANSEERPLYEVVAEKAREWNQYGNVGLGGG